MVSLSPFRQWKMPYRSAFIFRNLSFRRKASRLSAQVPCGNSALISFFFGAALSDRFVYYNRCFRTSQVILALSLFMTLVFGTNYHNFAVSFDHLALIAHGFDGRSDFHDMLPRILCLFSLPLLGEAARRADGVHAPGSLEHLFSKAREILCYAQNDARSAPAGRAKNRSNQFLLLHVILPFVRSYGLISSLTASPSMMRI